MSLDLGKLEKARELGGGIVQARCPACAESGGDRKGEHLRVYPDGRFGCCVNPKDSEHRKRIFALAGDKKPRGQFTVRVAGNTAMAGVRSVVGELQRGFGTAGTARAELKLGGLTVPPFTPDNPGTAGTPILNPRAYTRDKEIERCTKDCKCGVPEVPEQEGGEGLLQPAEKGEKLPYLDGSGGLVIPFDSPERYHWWMPDGKRQSVKETLAEVKQRIARKRMDHER